MYIYQWDEVEGKKFAEIQLFSGFLGNQAFYPLNSP